MNRTHNLLLVLAMVAASSTASAQAPGTDFSKIQIQTQQLTPNLYLLSGSEGGDPNHQDAAGGRIALFTTTTGILMVDAQYAQLADTVLATIRHISSAPIRVLVNTHVHIDHTGGNARFAREGATIYAREELREEMLHPPGGGAARDPAGLPSVTYGGDSPVSLHMGGETIDLIPVKAAHTGGDSMVRFENANVIMIGDFYRNFGYPFIDTANGGSLNGMIAALDELLRLARPDTKLVPGHGTIIDRTALVPYRAMILAVRDRVGGMVTERKSLDEVLAAKVTADYDAKVAGGLLPAGSGTSADRFVTEVYQELTSRK